ncbi:LysM peptidoglycan-binding domain-containing protein [Pengzhenrongella frigida]|uniref:LysM peptidoglycan-binding domain-containing protein n=1 Tax=Pengzhenrongella frigida TaxID=1259133 RepID=A0A4Q5N0Z2_9MICO|nr:LysM peptidoglycan-binding domain-containing protein [Cellulomonas sp. HLT2-17]RYV50177.1 LysM peptidoglycan-binding domain-containing protein [Cellulomonas sp. HLT2-17]
MIRSTHPRSPAWPDPALPDRTRPADTHRPVRLASLAGAASAALAAAGALSTRLAAIAPEAVSGLTPVDELVGLGALAAGAAVAWWLALGLVTAVGCAAVRGLGRRWSAGERFVARHAPAIVRRGLALTIGAGVGLVSVIVPAVAQAADPPVDLGWVATRVAVDPAEGGTGSDAPRPAEAAPTAGAEVSATPSEPTTSTPAPTASASAPTAGAPVPTASAPAPTASTSAPAAGAPEPTASASDPAVGASESPPDPAAAEQRVTVQAGDSLWRIAADHLALDASDADIAVAWPAWFETNRAVVGDDPHQIHPGQVLSAPGRATQAGQATPPAHTTGSRS